MEEGDWVKGSRKDIAVPSSKRMQVEKTIEKKTFAMKGNNVISSYISPNNEEFKEKVDKIMKMIRRDRRGYIIQAGNINS